MPMIMATEHSGFNISTDAIKTKVIKMSADSEITKLQFLLVTQKQNKSLINKRKWRHKTNANITCKR